MESANPSVNSDVENQGW